MTTPASTVPSSWVTTSELLDTLGRITARSAQCAVSHQFSRISSASSTAIQQNQSVAVTGFNQTNGVTDMTENGEVANYNLALYRREAAAYESAQEHYFRAIHGVLAHVDTLLREHSLLGMRENEPTTSGEIKLPWSYALQVDVHGPGASSYWLYSIPYSRRGRTFVARTSIFRDGDFAYEYSTELLPEFDRVLQNGLLDRVGLFVTLPKKERAAMLYERGPSDDDDTEASDEEWDPSEEFDEDEAVGVG